MFISKKVLVVTFLVLCIACFVAATTLKSKGYEALDDHVLDNADVLTIQARLTLLELRQRYPQYADIQASVIAGTDRFHVFITTDDPNDPYIQGFIGEIYAKVDSFMSRPLDDFARTWKDTYGFEVNFFEPKDHDVPSSNANRNYRQAYIMNLVTKHKHGDITDRELAQGMKGYEDTYIQHLILQIVGGRMDEAGAIDACLKADIDVVLFRTELNKSLERLGK